jgi:hypothetical protein
MKENKFSFSSYSSLYIQVLAVNLNMLVNIQVIKKSSCRAIKYRNMTLVEETTSEPDT